METLKAGRWPIYELRFAEELAEEERQIACRLADDLQVSYTVEPGDVLRKRCGSQEHQGYLAKMPPYPYEKLSTLETDWPDCPLFLFLDGIQDPYNFGAILRSAEVFGTHAVVIGERNQAGVTSQVARSSAGAVNHLKIIREHDLCATVSDWKGRGVKVFGASEKASVSLEEADFTRPTAIVIGNEGTGIGREILAECDPRIAIPQSGRVGSLNAAVAAGILLYEVKRQRTH